MNTNIIYFRARSTTDLEAITGDIRDIPQQNKRVIPRSYHDYLLKPLPSGTSNMVPWLAGRVCLWSENYKSCLAGSSGGGMV